MSTDSNIPILGRIAAKINPDPNNYNYINGPDYYGSPVHTAFGLALTNDWWPSVRKEYLLDARWV